jgi:hypothetical protein
MRLLFLLLIMNVFTNVGLTQVRNGWRSVYDKEGRLSRINYYDNGKLLVDSNRYYQYYTENSPKAIVMGEINSSIGCINGTVTLFDPTGMLTNYTINRDGNKIYDLTCDYYGTCSSVWIELFDSDSKSWMGDAYTIANSQLVLHDRGNLKVLVYNPAIPIDINQAFACKLMIPVKNNNETQALALGWKDEKNCLLFEIRSGKDYAITKFENGQQTSITNGWQAVDFPHHETTEVVLKRTGKTFTFEINGSIQFIVPAISFKGDHFALLSRSSGEARFNDWIVRYTLPDDDASYNRHWIGKATGFFISTSGRVLTTHDAVMDAKQIRVKGKINNQEYTLPAKVIRVDETNNLAVLQVNDPNFKPFEAIPFGYSNVPPVSESNIYCIGFPNSIASIYMSPEVFEGKIIPGTLAATGHNQLELDFRNGMIGAPVFDIDFNLLGICSNKGLELRYSELIEFQKNARIFMAYMGQTERKIESPLKGKTYQEKYKVGAELVVIVEANYFGPRDLTNTE